jgi:hypothetical protein
VWRERAPIRPEPGDREHSEAKRSWDELEGLDPRPWLRHQVRADSTLILPARQVPCPTMTLHSMGGRPSGDLARFRTELQ